jgi:hypothetical protein
MEEEGGGGVWNHPHGPRSEQDGSSLQLCSGQVYLFIHDDLMVQSVIRYLMSVWCEQCSHHSQSMLTEHRLIKYRHKSKMS